MRQFAPVRDPDMVGVSVGVLIGPASKLRSLRTQDHPVK